MKGAYIYSAMKSDLWSDKKKYHSPWQTISSSTAKNLAILQGAPPLPVPHSWKWTATSLLTTLDSSCLVLFSAWFIRIDVLHNISTACWIISPTTSKNSQVLVHQITTGLLSFIASIGCHSNHCAETLLVVNIISVCVQLSRSSDHSLRAAQWQKAASHRRFPRWPVHGAVPSSCQHLSWRTLPRYNVMFSVNSAALHWICVE